MQMGMTVSLQGADSLFKMIMQMRQQASQESLVLQLPSQQPPAMNSKHKSNVPAAFWAQSAEIELESTPTESSGSEATYLDSISFSDTPKESTSFSAEADSRDAQKVVQAREVATALQHCFFP